MLTPETYEYSLNRYIVQYPNSDEFEYIIGNLYILRRKKSGIQGLSDYRIQEIYLEKHNNTPPESYDIITEWGKEYKKDELSRIERKIKFYQIRLDRLNNRDIEKYGKEKQVQNLNWSGDQLQLSELIKALLEARMFVGHPDKEVFQKVFELFNVEYSDSIKRDRISTIRGRVHDMTPFLNILQSKLEQFIKDKDADRLNK
ncbi:RteC domain-containing protein [Flagellimonas marinaquae]|nr:RteC domain-containing protein [Allomuricauda aquimarina]